MAFWRKASSSTTGLTHVRASVQQSKLHLDDIDGGAVTLSGGEHRMVLEVFALNFDLKSPVEQEAIVAGFRAMLNALTFPVQILVRIQRLDVEGYAEELRCCAEAERSRPLCELALAQIGLVRELASSRLLLGRRFFVVIPSSEAPPTSPAGLLARLGLAANPSRGSSNDLLGARRELTQRCDELTRGLAGIGLRSRVLGTEELLTLYLDFLCPTQARVQPLRRHLVDYTTPVVRSRSRLTDMSAEGRCSHSV
jgi:hypothetical protein